MSDKIANGQSGDVAAQILNYQRVNKKTATDFIAGNVIVGEDAENVIGTGVLKIDGSGNIIGTGYFIGKKSGIFANLTAPANTTVTTALTYYPILGTFGNTPIEGFSGATTYTPGIKYDDPLTRYFEIDWHATIRVGSVNSTVHMGISLNGTFIPASEMATLGRITNEEYPLSGTVVVELATDDEIQLVLTSDGNGDVITVDHYTTTIRPFFN